MDTKSVPTLGRTLDYAAGVYDLLAAHLLSDQAILLYFMMKPAKDSRFWVLEYTFQG
jgi:hypothetical protein